MLPPLTAARVGARDDLLPLWNLILDQTYMKPVETSHEWPGLHAYLHRCHCWARAPARSSLLLALSTQDHHHCRC